MDKKLFSAYIKEYENSEIDNFIGKIDVDFLCENSIESLYYAIPLIERIILEIYKLIPEADIEYYDQGTMRTPIAIIDKNEELNILPRPITNLIKKIFDDNGIRNRLFHVSCDRITIKANFEEIRLLIALLVGILNTNINVCNKYDFYEIEHI